MAALQQLFHPQDIPSVQASLLQAQQHWMGSLFRCWQEMLWFD